MQKTDSEIFDFSVGKEKAYLYPNFFPILNEKIITICIDNDYIYWNELIQIIAPFLYQEKILPICVSNFNKKPIKYCAFYEDANIRHYAYIASKSIINIGNNDWFASLSDGKYINCNDRLPEEAAKEILKKLNIDGPISIKTLFRGLSYGYEYVDIVPNFIFSPNNNLPETQISVRCDICENWKFVIDISNSIKNVFVTTRKYIPISVIPFIKNIKKVNFYLDENTSYEDVKSLEKSGIKYSLFYDGPSQNVSQIKAKFFDFAPISVIENWLDKNIDNLKELDQSTHLKSSRSLVSKEGNFMSLFHMKRGIRINEPRGTQLMDGLEDEDFKKEADLFLYFKK